MTQSESKFITIALKVFFNKREVGTVFEGLTDVSRYLIALGAVTVLAAAGFIIYGNILKLRNDQFETDMEQLRYDPNPIPEGNLLAHYWLLKRANACSAAALLPAIFTVLAVEGRISFISMAGDEPTGDDIIMLKPDSDSLDIAGPADELFSQLSEAAVGKESLSVNEMVDSISQSGKGFLRWYGSLERRSRRAAAEAGILGGGLLGLGLSSDGKQLLYKLLSLKVNMTRSLQDRGYGRTAKEEWRIYLVYSVLFDMHKRYEDTFRRFYYAEADEFDAFWKDILAAASVARTIDLQLATPYIDGKSKAFSLD